ncbi:phage integrase family protein [Caballeronia sp. LZ029]|uniref:phage integrase family protein n=1 Tax=Caballeronia sp. LZ029 TaxID=3038564 RepID=UPI002854D82A|nr:phage integrase family protein [Caballeronia sp. LZ029]MDR5749130.1 phage integrase family protein [Caballeronia sp. LZ029]
MANPRPAVPPASPKASARATQKAPPEAAPEKLTAKPARAPEKLTESPALERRYTTKDFTALRAYVQRIPPAVIARTYYDPDEDAHAATPGAMERHLTTMLDALVALALAHGSAALADHLRASIKQHGQPKLTAVTFRMVTEAAQLAALPPRADHPIGAWLRPRVARRLKGTGIQTLSELVAFCNRRGGSWWRSIPRIGPGRARAIVSWLRRQQASLQLTIDADVDSVEQDGIPLIAAELVEVVPASKVTVSGPSGGLSGSGPNGGQSNGGPGGASSSAGRLTLAPLERLSVPHALSGAAGENRATAFCYIQAGHDLDAVRAYLNRFRDQPKTLRAYTKELERFLLWAVVLRGNALSDLRVDDCEAYKDFLKAPDPRFVGERFPRHSPRWRPFALSDSSAAADGQASLSATLSPESQRYTVRVLRTAFTWWVDVRYLAGNPWMAVNDPVVIKRERAMKIERALPAGLWRKLRDELDVRSAAEGAATAGAQWRAVRAVILLMGDSGLRREEAASARREDLRPSSYSTFERPVWELTIVGKGQRERTVPVSAATLNALRAHWVDRGQDFDGATGEDKQRGPLLSPVVIPWTDASRRRHRAGQSGDGQPATEAGYTADGLNRLISRMVTELVETMDGLSLDERMRLGQSNAHAFRHTFGTQSVADEVPVDVVQKVLGHASLQTTTLYVQAEKQRVVEEVARYYAGVAAHKTGQ